MRDDHNDLLNRHDDSSRARRINADATRTPQVNPRVLLEIGHTMFLLPAGTNLHEAHAAAALLTRSMPITEEYETQTLKPASPCRIRFALIAPAQAPDAPPALATWDAPALRRGEAAT